LGELESELGDCLATRRLAVVAAGCAQRQLESAGERPRDVFCGISAVDLFRALCEKGVPTSWWLSEREAISEDWQIASWLMAVCLIPPDDFKGLGSYIEADLSTLSKPLVERVVLAVHEDAPLIGASHLRFPAVGPRTTCLLSGRVAINRDQAWLEVVRSAEGLTSVLHMGASARDVAIRSILRAGASDQLVGRGKSMRLLEMLGAEFSMPEELWTKIGPLHRREVLRDPYRWPHQAVISVFSDSAVASSSGRTVAVAAEQMGWFNV
jgi:hypothetical protein